MFNSLSEKKNITNTILYFIPFVEIKERKYFLTQVQRRLLNFLFQFSISFSSAEKKFFGLIIILDLLSV